MDKKITLLDTSLLAICGGVAMSALYPPYAAISGIMTYSGIVGTGYYFATLSRFDRLWRNLNLCKGAAYPMLKSRLKTDKSMIYKFTLPAGLTLQDFDHNKLAIEQYLGRDVDIKYTYKEIVIEVYNQGRKNTYEYQVTDCKGAVAFPVGYDRKGELVTCDLSSGEPHMLIAGETGSGKSTALRAIITNLILTQNIKLHLIDLKRGAEFQIFAKCSKVESFSRTRAEAENVLQKISAEIDRRYDLLFKNDCVNIKEYIQKGHKMGYEMIIVDEFADLQHEKGSISLVEEIAAKARACGIHLIISTQRPDHIVLNGRIKANVTTILGLKTTNEANSRIIIDRPGLEALRGHGNGIFKRGREIEVQCPLLSPEDTKELLRHTYVERVDKTASAEIKDFDFLEGLK